MKFLWLINQPDIVANRGKIRKEAMKMAKALDEVMIQLNLLHEPARHEVRYTPWYQGIIRPAKDHAGKGPTGCAICDAINKANEVLE